MTKSIVFFSDEALRDIAYGLLFFVPGTKTAALNEYVRHHAEQWTQTLNQDSLNWITCRIICLDSDNPFFPVRENAALYSAMLPTDGNSQQGYCFLSAQLQVDTPQQAEKLFSEYYRTLLQMFDEVLDEGSFRSYHLQDFEIPDSYERPNEKRRLLRCHSPFGKKESCQELAAPQAQVFAEACEIDLAPGIKPAEPSRLEITPNAYHVLLPDYEREIHFTAQVKALYILFLNHPEGIRLKEISDYKDEYKHLYFNVTNRSDTDKIRHSVERLLDVCNPNVLYVKKAQCSSALYRAIPENDLRRYYEIEVDRGEAHKIELDRSLVSMPECLKSL